MKFSNTTYPRWMAVGFAAAVLSSCAAVQSMRGDDGQGVLFPSIDGEPPPPIMDMAAAPVVSQQMAEVTMSPADPLSAPPPNGTTTAGGSQRVPLGALSSTAAQPAMAQPAPQPRMSIEEAQLQSAAAQEALVMREFKPQPAVINAPTPMSPPPATAEDQGRREFVPASLQAPRTMRDAAPGVTLSAGDRNIIQRFDALNKLRDAELITGEEYQKRRMANLGAILPYSKPLPGQGLERPVPSAEAIIARIAALGRSLEMRAITPRQHQLERGMILNALLHEAPDAKATRRPPPADFLEAAGMVGKLEYLRAQGLINDDEFDAESDAIDKFMNTGAFPVDRAAAEPRRRAEPAMAAKPAEPAKPTEPPKPMISGPVIHLASFRSEDAAMKGWQEAQTRAATVLAPLQPVVRKIDLGDKQGIFYRLMAGPFPDLAAAELACIEMKKTGQFCRATDANS